MLYDLLFRSRLRTARDLVLFVQHRVPLSLDRHEGAIGPDCSLIYADLLRIAGCLVPSGRGQIHVEAAAYPLELVAVVFLLEGKERRERTLVVVDSLTAALHPRHVTTIRRSLYLYVAFDLKTPFKCMG